MATERPWPNSAVVHWERTGQRSHTSGSNSTMLPNAKRCTCPWGHSIVRSRRFSLKADLGNRLPLCDFHGLHTILPRRPSTSSTSPLLMYPRSISSWSIATPCRSMSIFGDAIANAHPTALGIRFQILRADLHQRLDMVLERGLGDFLGQAARDPRLQGVQLTQERLDRLGLLDRVVPVDIERPLDTRLHE